MTTSFSIKVVKTVIDYSVEISAGYVRVKDHNGLVLSIGGSEDDYCTFDYSERIEYFLENVKNNAIKFAKKNKF